MSGHLGNDDKLVYTFKESWQYSGLGRDYLREAIRAGRLRTIRVGRVHKVPKAELEAFILKEVGSNDATI